MLPTPNVRLPLELTKTLSKLVTLVGEVEAERYRGRGVVAGRDHGALVLADLRARSGRRLPPSPVKSRSGKASHRHGEVEVLGRLQEQAREQAVAAVVVADQQVAGLGVEEAEHRVELPRTTSMARMSPALTLNSK